MPEHTLDYWSSISNTADYMKTLRKLGLIWTVEVPLSASVILGQFGSMSLMQESRSRNLSTVKMSFHVNRSLKRALRTTSSPWEGLLLFEVWLFKWGKVFHRSYLLSKNNFNPQLNPTICAPCDKFSDWLLGVNIHRKSTLYWINKKYQLMHSLGLRITAKIIQWSKKLYQTTSLSDE